MSKLTISAHTLVRNEQNWIWFSLMSVLDYVDELLVWDDSSTDLTGPIVQTISSPKVKYRRVQTSSASGHTQMRQQMLDSSQADWILILDGDEVWWWDSIAVVCAAIRTCPDAAAVVSPFYNAVGDVYHFQDPVFNDYRVHNIVGTIRAINRRLPNLRVVNPHGCQEYQTQGVALQNLPRSRLLFVNAYYFHLTHLHRSPHDATTLKRAFKYRYELGRGLFPLLFPPQVFFLPRPPIVPSPWRRRFFSYNLISLLVIPARIVKRSFFPTSFGY